MVLDWFRRNVSVPELIGKKEFAKAIELARRQLEEDNSDKRLRLQLADALSAGNASKEAIEVLTKLADEYGQEGYATKAIALLKKIQKLDPGRSEIETKLTHMISHHEASSSTRPARPPAAPAPTAGAAAGAAGTPAKGPVVWWTPPESSAKLRTGSRPASGGAAAPEPAKPQKPSLSNTPLFSSFSEEELVAVIRGLDLKSFEPGEIIVSEGEPGSSLFVIAEGMVRVFVKNASGRNVQIREMGEGTFFGEISILAGKARTATITARSHCELLELDRDTLESISKKQPRVKDVLQEFYDQRAHNVNEVSIRADTGEA